MSNLTGSGDANKLGYLAFSASSIVREKGRLFLFVAPVGSLRGKNKAHNGTYIFEFEDISRGLLKRNAEDELIVKKFIQIGLAQDGSGDYYELTQGGPSDYDESNNYGGIIFPQRNTKWAPNVFRLYNTRMNVAD